MAMLAFFGGIIVAAIAFGVLLFTLADASSRSGKQAPAYHTSRQSVRLGPAAYHTEYAQVTLHAKLDVQTPYGRASYTSSGPPDAVLYGVGQVATALARSWERQPAYARPVLVRNNAPRAITRSQPARPITRSQPARRSSSRSYR
jgi:hypothetical protein